MATKKTSKKKPAKKAAKAPAKRPAKKAAKKAPKKVAKKAPKKVAKKASKTVANKAKATPAQKVGPVAAQPTVGSTAPAFALGGDDGATHTLAGHAGAPVVVYFYPRDDTPGCTTEACDFRDNMARATAKGAVVYGISRDTLVSHAKFKAKHNLNFTLLSDPDLVTHRAYGAWGEKIMYGKPTEGVLRSTYLVDKNGKIAAAWPRVKVDGHVDAVLAALDQLGS